MKITTIECIPLRLPFLDPFTIAAPYERSRNYVDTLIVKLHTDEGIYGIGETQAWRRQGSGEVLQNLVTTIKTIYEPLLTGKSPLQINEIMGLCESAVYHSTYAQAAISDALYDVVGKYLGLPVCDLLGGKCRESIPVGICVPIFPDTAVMLDKAQQFYDKGYRHIRIKIGINAADDERNAAAFRKCFGDKITLRADANAGMTYPEALRLLKKMEQYDFDMVEQPVSLWDLDSMADLARHCSIPLSVDESVSTEESLLRVIEKRAASIVQTKTGKNGGIYYCRKLWELARTGGMQIFPGNHPTTSVGCAAVTHLAASWNGTLMVGDYQNALDGVFVDDIVKTPLRIENGQVLLPSGPGLGMELDEEKLARYRVG